MVIIIFIIFVYFAVNCLIQMNLTNIAKMREGKKFDDFLEYFSRESIPKTICYQVYSYLQNIDSNFNNFPIYPTDNLGLVYGICDEDLDEMVLELIDLLGYQIPTRNILRQMKPVKTVEDLIKFLASLQEISR